MNATTRKWLAGGAVVLLALVAVALTLLALERVHTPPEDGDVAPVPTFTQPTAATPSPSTPQAEVPQAETSFAPVERAQERFLAAGSGVLWRGEAGSCGDAAPLLERSTDGGATWSDVAPEYLGIGQLSRIDPFADDQAQIVASMGEDCEVQALRTFTQGQFWESSPEALAGTGYIDPADASQVIAGGVGADAPCADARGLRSSRSMLALVCDGTAFSADADAFATDADAAWRALPATGVVALAIADDAVMVAYVSATCDGLQLTRYAEEETDAGCVPVSDAAAPAAIAVDGRDVLVWSGDDEVTAAPSVSH